MSKSKGNLVLRLAAARGRRRPDGDPAGAARAPLPLRLGVDRRRPRRRPGPAGTPGVRRSAGASRDQAEGLVPPCAPRSADDLDAPAALAAVDAWAAAAGTAPGPTCPQLVDARLGVARSAAASLDASVTSGTRAVDDAVTRVTTPVGRGRRRSVVVGLAALEVALELPGDGLAARLGEVGGVPGLLEGPDVVADLLVLLGELVDAALPGRAPPRAGRPAGC